MGQFHQRGHWNHALLLGGQPENEKRDPNEMLDETLFFFSFCLIIIMT